jgi:hypothetical protein
MLSCASAACAAGGAALDDSRAYQPDKPGLELYDDVAWYEGRYPSQLKEGRPRSSRPGSSARMSARAAAAAGTDTGEARSSAAAGQVHDMYEPVASLQPQTLVATCAPSQQLPVCFVSFVVLSYTCLRLTLCVADVEYAEYAAGLDDYLRSRGAAGPDPDRADRPVAAKVANRRSYLSDK